MYPTIAYWLFGAGLTLLALGGQCVVRGGVTLKRALGFSPVIVGLFAISLGSASPTLAVAAQATASNISGMAIGVVIGATLINLLLILGLGALIQPMSSAPKVVLRDGGALLAASLALVALVLHGQIGRREGVLLLGGLVVYAIIVAVSDWRQSSNHSVACAAAENHALGQIPSAGGGLFAVVVGVICLALGAHFAVGAGAMLAVLWSLPPEAVALTAVALGVSLPVLLITAIASVRGHTQIAIGHLISASVFNLLGVLGLAALVRPLTVAPSFAAGDSFAVLGAALLLLALLSTNWRLSRPKALALLLAYAGYLGFLAWRFHVAGLA